jgi:hypothetical protein
MENNGVAWINTARCILYHSQNTSARTLFLRHASGSVIAPEPLPFLSTLIEDDEANTESPEVFLHPAALIHEYSSQLGLPAGLLQVVTEFHQRVETAAQPLNIYLARFTCIDPPRQLFADSGGKFCAITELRGGHPAEMVLLQLAYQAIMG